MKEKLKKFWEEHKEQVVMGALAIGAFALGIYVAKDHSRVYISESDDYDEVPEMPTGIGAQLVDEDIFTSLAPQIESAVIEEGLDEFFTDRVYTMKYPKNGDPDQGIYEVKKKVEVSVHDITEE